MKNTTWYILGAATLTVLAAVLHAQAWLVCTAAALTVAATAISLTARAKAHQ